MKYNMRISPWRYPRKHFQNALLWEIESSPSVPSRTDQVVVRSVKWTLIPATHLGREPSSISWSEAREPTRKSESLVSAKCYLTALLHFCLLIFFIVLFFSSIRLRPDYCSECFYNNELKLIVLYLYVVISTLFTFTCTSMFMTQHVSFSLQVFFTPVFSSRLTLSARCRE